MGRRPVLAWSGSAVLAMALSFPAFAADECVGQVPLVRVIAQPILSISYLDKVKAEFEQKWQTKVEIQIFGENERRAKSRLEASQGSQAYQVYYVDEANRAEFADAGWIIPLLDYMPKDWGFDDILDSRKAIISYKGTPYYAPLEGGGSIMMYRKDLAAEKDLKAPKSVQEMKQFVAALNDPPRFYGNAIVGRRGSGMNVWRWSLFFRGYGGSWVDGGKAAFASDAGVKATQDTVDLLKYSPPGSATYSWSEAIEGFRAGQVGLVIDADVFGPWMEDPEKSRVVGMVGYAPPPDPMWSGGWAHGLAISTKGNPTECSKKVSGAFIAWATSGDMEARKVKDGILSEYGRKSTLENPEFTSKVNAEYVQAIKDGEPKTALPVWESPKWTEVGDGLGLVLEQIFTGGEPDTKAALDNAAQQADDVIAR